MNITAPIPASSLVKGVLEDGLHGLEHGDGGLVGEDALVLEHCMDFLNHRDYVSYYSCPWHCSVSARIPNIHSAIYNVSFDFLYSEQECSAECFVFHMKKKRGMRGIVYNLSWGEVNDRNSMTHEEGGEAGEQAAGFLPDSGGVVGTQV